MEEPDRAELRRRLREKIRGKRGGGPELAQRLRDDPTTAMLQLGLDDATLLNSAKSIVKDPHGFLQSVKDELVATDEAVPKDDDDEEAPPAAS